MAFVFGLALLALTAARQVVRKNPRKVAGAAAAVVILVLVAHQVGAVPGPRRFARSLGVRLDYWRTSVEMARQRPLFGVGPGSWPEWYAMLKEPEFEETQAAHSVYVQLWAETGSVGLLLWIGLWAVLFGQALRARAASPGRDREANGSVAAERARARRRLRAVGLGLAALVLAFDWAVLGTFGAPRYVPEWLEAHSWLPYLVVYIVWAATFAAIFGGPKWSPTWAVAAGLAAFLLHSAAEFTLRVPAIGGTAAVLAAALLAGANRPRRREWRVGRLRAGVILLAGAAAVACWSVVATGRSVDGALSSATADILRNEFLAGDGQLRRDRELRAQADEITAERRRACAAVPWDDRAWRDLGGWLITLAEGGLDGGATAEAARALDLAVELNPLSSPNRALLGRAHALAGDYAGAAAAYRRAAQLHPALPVAWYRLGAALEAAGGADAEALAAYQTALELMPRQYHARNRVLGPPAHLASFWARMTGALSPQPLLDIAADLASGAAGIEVPAGATERQKVARLTEGLEGGAELARKWDSYEPAVRQQEVWNLLAGRMWQWALRRKVQLLQDMGNAGEGGSSGAR
ncbi:MAG: O-antigen ligase family protein, partial [Candidatus Brocadiae bacterium]|nr:O-antigen ligase family protein [Candidatus Brocadiia bacterium]